MTRANLNFIYFNDTADEKERGYKLLYNYQNGDQYPTGIKQFYKVLDFIKSDWTPADFIKWQKENYGHEPEEINPPQPKIYYTDGFITDYSYIFDAKPNSRNENKIIVYNWSNKIFEGDPAEFEEWLIKQEKDEENPDDSHRHDFEIGIYTKSDRDTTQKQIAQTFDEEVKAGYFDRYRII